MDKDCEVMDETKIKERWKTSTNFLAVKIIGFLVTVN